MPDRPFGPCPDCGAHTVDGGNPLMPGRTWRCSRRGCHNHYAIRSGFPEWWGLVGVDRSGGDDPARRWFAVTTDPSMVGYGPTPQAAVDALRAAERAVGMIPFHIRALPDVVKEALLSALLRSLHARFGRRVRAPDYSPVESGAALAVAMRRTLTLAEAAFFAERLGYGPVEAWEGNPGKWSDRLAFLRAAQGFFPRFESELADPEEAVAREVRMAILGLPPTRVTQPLR